MLNLNQDELERSRANPCPNPHVLMNLSGFALSVLAEQMPSLRIEKQISRYCSWRQSSAAGSADGNVCNIDLQLSRPDSSREDLEHTLALGQTGRIIDFPSGRPESCCRNVLHHRKTLYEDCRSDEKRDALLCAALAQHDASGGEVRQDVATDRLRLARHESAAASSKEHCDRRSRELLPSQLQVPCHCATAAIRCRSICFILLPVDELLATITRGAWISHDLVGQDDGNIELLPQNTGRRFFGHSSLSSWDRAD